MQKFLYLFIFLIPLLVNPWGFQLYGPVKMAWFLVFVAGAFFYLFWRVLKDGEFKFYVNKSVFLYIGAFLGVALISSILAQAPVRSFLGEYDYMRGWIFYLLLSVHFFVLLQIFRDQKLRNVFVTGLKVMTFLVCVHALGQYFNLDPFRDTDNAELLFRIYGNFGQPNFLGQFLIFPLVFDAFDFLEKRARVLNGGLILTILVTLLLTQNRATWLALLVGFLVWLFVFTNVKKIWKALAIVAFVSAIFVAVFYLDFRSLNSRFLMWEGAIQLFDFRNIWFGNGFNSFENLYVSVKPATTYLYENFYTNAAHVHNSILEVLIELGIFGLVLYLVPIVYLLKNLKKVGAAGFSLVIYFVSVQFSFSVIEHFVFLAAMWAMVTLDLVKFKQVKVKFFSFVRVFSVMFLSVFLAVAVLFSAFFVMRTDYYLVKAFDNYSFQLFHRAAYGSYFDYPNKLVVDLFAGEKVGDYLEKYGFITGKDYKYKLLAVEYYGVREEWEKVEVLAQELMKQAPNLPAVYTKLGDIYFDAGDCEMAVPYYQKLSELAPEFQDSEKRRLFLKHASAYVDAMANLEYCQNDNILVES